MLGYAFYSIYGFAHPLVNKHAAMDLVADIGIVHRAIPGIRLGILPVLRNFGVRPALRKIPIKKAIIKVQIKISDCQYTHRRQDCNSGPSLPTGRRT